jgi:triphosphoribosyl-dephospho-CoA synthetase
VNARAGTTQEGWTATDAVAGILAALSIFASALGLVYRPARLLPFAVLLALVAGRMSARNDRLVLLAVVAAVVCWTVGMTIAIVTENPIY